MFQRKGHGYFLRMLLPNIPTPPHCAVAAARTDFVFGAGIGDERRSNDEYRNASGKNIPEMRMKMVQTEAAVVRYLEEDRHHISLVVAAACLAAMPILCHYLWRLHHFSHCQRS